MDNTGLSLAFKAICGEVLAKNVPSEDILGYTVGRLKELGKQIDKIKAVRISIRAFVWLNFYRAVLLLKAKKEKKVPVLILARNKKNLNIQQFSKREWIK